MLTLTTNGWMGQLAIMTLASLLSCLIYSAYPDMNPTFRPFYGLVKPLQRYMFPEICILWSRTGSFDKKAHAFECNHVVPLILLVPAEPDTSVQLRTVKKPIECKILSCRDSAYGRTEAGHLVVQRQGIWLCRGRTSDCVEAGHLVVQRQGIWLCRGRTSDCVEAGHLVVHTLTCQRRPVPERFCVVARFHLGKQV